MEPDDRDLLIRIDMNVTSLVASREDHEVRIRALEATRQSQRGAIAVITTVVSAIWGLALAAFEVFGGRHHG